MNSAELVKKIVITGGPCAGKSSAMADLLSRLMQVGVFTLTVPEAATVLFGSGINPAMLQEEFREGGLRFQKQVLEYQLLQEAFFLRQLTMHKGKQYVLLCDRGLMDGMAYVESAEFQAMLHDQGLSIATARNERYDAVMHMVTAAEGAEAYYNLDNPARTESPELARNLDHLTQQAWVGHEHLRVIANRTVNNQPVSFAEKKSCLVREVFHAIGIPSPVEIERKYLVKWFDPESIPVPYSRTLIEQHYLESDQVIERRVRKMTPQASSGQTSIAYGTPLYVYTEKVGMPGSVSRLERERVISAVEYVALLRERSKDRPKPIVKTRHSLVFKNQYIQIDFFADRFYGLPLVIAEIELTEEQQVVELPDFFKEVREVTEDPHYRNASLAQFIA
jgi:CYTH domain-containing protein